MPTRSQVRQFVRQFHENGMKRLLEQPANVRDLLRIAGAGPANLIDFDKLTASRTTLVKRDYRHLEADLILTAPLLPPRDRRLPAVTVTVYILIEHQSQKDRWMPLRVLDSVVQIFRGQARRPQRAASGDLLEPVLPVVFCSIRGPIAGTRSAVSRS